LLYLFLSKSIEAEIAEKRQQQSLLSLNRREMDNEMQDLIRSKTEVECLVADLRSAEDSNDGATEQLQNQLQDISQRISEKEVELMEIEPEWVSGRQQEMDEKRKYARC
jgi:structural maintenance of chromosome 3 (chondroitin sulfate proteoglycan 6)